MSLILTLAACDGTVLPTIPDPAPPLSTPAPVSVTVTVYRAPLEAQLLHDARVRLVSGSDEPQVVRVRWEATFLGRREVYEQDWTVPPRGAVQAFPDCFYGGAYQIGVLGHRISFTRDFGQRQAFCY